MRNAPRDTMAAFLAPSGLTLKRYEMLGREGKLSAIYGFALAEREGRDM
jgi:hypothetical protein